MTKKTLFHDEHVARGGKMVDFAGWMLPVQFSSLLAEHEAVRTRAGLFDVSHMGEFFAEGPGALGFVQRLITNDAAVLPDGAVLYTPMCREDGTIVDDLLVYRYSPAKFLLVVNAANIDKDFAWCASVAKSFDVILKNVSAEWSQLALQGPLAERTLAKICPAPLAAMKPFTFAETTVAGIAAIVSRTGYTAEDGFEIYFTDPTGVKLFGAILDAGRADGVVPVGLGARDTLRFEGKLMLYGNDIDDTTTPIEAGLAWTVKFGKGEFNGRSVMLEQKEKGTARKLVGLRMLEKGVARHGHRVLVDGKPAGIVTSGTKSPTLGEFLALAYVPASHAAPGSIVEVEIRDAARRAEVVKTPFYRRQK